MYGPESHFLITLIHDTSYHPVTTIFDTHNVPLKVSISANSQATRRREMCIYQAHANPGAYCTYHT